MVLAIVSPIFDELALPRAYEFTLKMDCSLQLDVRIGIHQSDLFSVTVLGLTALYEKLTAGYVRQLHARSLGIFSII